MKGFYILVQTIVRALPKVLRFPVGVLPFFIGYALLGLVLFGDESDLFGSIIQTCVTLFAVVNGDEVLSTFENLSFMGIWGQLYLMFFTLLFTYVILMSIIAIVEEAFFSSTTMVSDIEEEKDEQQHPTHHHPHKNQQKQPFQEEELHQIAQELASSMSSTTLNTTIDMSNTSDQSTKGSSDNQERIMLILRKHLKSSSHSQSDR